MFYSSCDRGLTQSTQYHNKYKRTTDQELQTKASAEGQQADATAYATGRRCMCTHQMVALFCMKWRHGRHLESVMSNRKSNSVNWCVFIKRTIRQRFRLIRFEIKES